MRMYNPEGNLKLSQVAAQITAHTLQLTSSTHWQSCNLILQEHKIYENV